jgi:predicted metalloprotease with PDZ domain
MTHEFVHTALPDLPDDQHWMEEGLATYVEPLARAETGRLTEARVWAEFLHEMHNGEPERGDRGLNETQTWGRTYWGGAMFCLMADVSIRRETNDRKGLKDALRAVVDSGGGIDKDWPLSRVLQIGDHATGTTVLSDMYAKWSERPVPVDFSALWKELGVSAGPNNGVVFDANAPLAAVRRSISGSR